MNIYDYAMQMELDGEYYYRKLADRSKSTGLKKIFFMLAIEEIKHYKVIEQLKRELGIMQVEETKILDNVKKVFAEMKLIEQELLIDNIKELKIYMKAQDFEDVCRKFYLEKADQLEDVTQRRIFLQLAGEEDTHLRIMEYIIQFISSPDPANWLEKEEWHYLNSDLP